jgi:hypothetical protein
MYHMRVGFDGHGYAAAPTQVSTVVTPPAPAAQKLGDGLGGFARQMCSGAE